MPGARQGRMCPVEIRLLAQAAPVGDEPTWPRERHGCPVRCKGGHGVRTTAGRWVGGVVTVVVLLAAGCT